MSTITFHHLSVSLYFSNTKNNKKGLSVDEFRTPWAIVFIMKLMVNISSKQPGARQCLEHLTAPRCISIFTLSVGLLFSYPNKLLKITGFLENFYDGSYSKYPFWSACIKKTLGAWMSMWIHLIMQPIVFPPEEPFKSLHFWWRRAFMMAVIVNITSCDRPASSEDPRR